MVGEFSLTPLRKLSDNLSDAGWIDALQFVVGLDLRAFDRITSGYS